MSEEDIPEDERGFSEMYHLLAQELWKHRQAKTPEHCLRDMQAAFDAVAAQWGELRSRKQMARGYVVDLERGIITPR